LTGLEGKKVEAEAYIDKQAERLRCNITGHTLLQRDKEVGCMTVCQAVKTKWRSMLCCGMLCPALVCLALPCCVLSVAMGMHTWRSRPADTVRCVNTLQAQLGDNEAKQKEFTERLQHERSKLTGV
jgi:hypothetical protein